jgi:type I restriction enzyme S subunit
MDGEFEPHLWTGRKALLNQRVCKVEGSDRLDHIFLSYAIEKPLYLLQKMIAGTTVKHLSKSDIRSVNLPTPPLPEQRKIASVFYTVDQAIQKTEAIIEQSKRMKRGLIQDLFTDGFHEHDEHHGDQWSNFPKEWSLKTVGELLEDGAIRKMKDGNHGERHPTSDEFVDKGIPFVTSNAVKGSDIDWSKCRFIADATVQRLQKGFAQPGDVLLTHKGHVGRVGLVPDSVDLAVLSPQVTYYRTGDELGGQFLKYYLQTAHIQKQLMSHSQQTTRDYVGLTKQKKLRLAIPPRDEQEEIAQVLVSIDEQISENIRSASTLRRLKKGLMQDLLTGGVRTADKAIHVLDEVVDHG